MSGIARDRVRTDKGHCPSIVMENLHNIGRPNPFQQDRPGKDWWLGFMRRWPCLTERKPQHLPANRATALTEGAVSTWIDKVTTSVNRAGLGDLTTEELRKLMWNYDETAFSTDTASKKVLSRRGERMFMKQVVDAST